jgi:hypothetical protein
MNTLINIVSILDYLLDYFLTGQSNSQCVPWWSRTRHHLQSNQFRHHLQSNESMLQLILQTDSVCLGGLELVAIRNQMNQCFN